jgi:hypothetical protein
MKKFEFNSKWSKLIDLVDKLKKPKYKNIIVYANIHQLKI